MASIPTIVHLGNAELNGGQPNPPSNPATYGWSLWKNKPKLNWAIPYASDNSGGLANPVTYLPWFDTTLLTGSGDFTAYHHIAGILAAPYNVNMGDNHTALGIGFGSSAWYMQKFAEKYSTTPYFKALKFAYPGGIYDKWLIGGTSYAAAVAWWARAASLLFPTDTMDVKLIIIDTNGNTDGDIALIGSGSHVNYKTNMTALINQLRNTTFSSPNAKVILISHAPSYLLTTGTAIGALLFRQLNWELSTELTGVHCLEMSDDDLGTSTGTFGGIAYGSDRRAYEQDAYVRQGQAIYDLFNRVTASSVPVNNSKYIPAVLSIGDSQAVGPISSTVQAALYSQGTSGPRVNQYIYHSGNASIELLNPGVSCNLNNIVATTNIGSALTLTEKLGEKWPDGYLFLHLAKNGSAVTAEDISSYTTTSYGRWRKGVNQNYEQFAAFIAAARTALLTQTGAVQVQKQAFVELITIELGDNDTYSLASANKFEGGLRNLIVNLRNDYGAEMYGIKTPVVLVRPHINTALGSATTRAIIRDAIVSLSEEMDQVGYVDIDDTDLNVDGVHRSVEASIMIGYRIYEKFIEIVENAIPVL